MEKRNKERKGERERYIIINIHKNKRRKSE